MRQISKSKQRGISLLTVLLLLLIMTLLGVASLRSVLMQERMASNMLDRSIAFQNAESALREAEALIPTRPLYDGTVPGLYPLPVNNVTPRWLAAGTVWRNAADPGGLSPGAPQFIIEAMASGPLTRSCQKVVTNNPTCLAERYRITARSQANDRAQVVIQSIFAIPSP